MTEPSSSPAANRWPSQVKFILGNEACERFSYYGMKGILALYITNVLLQTRDQATNIIHLFGFANYFMPLLGAWVSDRFWGRYHTILWVSLSYCLGHGVMATSDFIPSLEGKALALYVGLGLIAFGSGGIKPCVAAFMGDQFKPEQRHLLQKAYAAFYWCINLGSTASFIIIPFIRREYGYSWAFGVPGIFMAIATFVFWLGTNRYVRVPPSRVSGRTGFFKVFFAAWAARGQRAPTQTFWDTARQRFTDAEVDAAKSIGPILGVFALIPVFWALFDQTFSTWVLQGENMRPVTLSAPQFRESDLKRPEILATKLTAHTNDATSLLWQKLTAQSQQRIVPTQDPATLKAGLVAALNQLMGDAAWYDSNALAAVKLGADTRFYLRHHHGPDETAMLNRFLLEDCFPEELGKLYRIGPEEMLSANPILVMILIPIMTLGLYPWLGRLATPLRRMSAGMFLSGFSFVVVAWLQIRLDAGVPLSILWQTVPYVVLTIAEVLVSTTGLEFAFREAAPEMKSTIMGFWNLTVAFGNLLVSAITLFAAKFLGGSAGHDISISPKMFLFYAGLTFVVAILFSLVAAKYHYRDQAAAAGK